jgi:DNA-binding Lrp family transcriptional regulator
MDLKHVLQRAAGVNRRFVYYLESKGYISPTRLPKERISRRDYSEQDLLVVRETWKYHRQGFSLQAAYDLGVKRERQITYVGLQVGAKSQLTVLQRLMETPEALEAGVVYADTADILVKMATPRESDLYEALVPLLVDTGVAGLPSIWRVRDRFAKAAGTRPKEGKTGMMAYLMLKVPGTGVAEVMDILREMEGVVEASTVYGESDVIVRVEVPSQDALDSLVMNDIHGIPSVESTRTYLVVGRTHWERSSTTP